MPKPRVSKVGIHIQLTPPFIHPCPILYEPHPCPIIPPPIDPVMAPPPKIRKRPPTTTNAITKGVLLDSFMTLYLQLVANRGVASARIWFLDLHSPMLCLRILSRHG